MFTAEELLPVKLTLELALITTVFLLLVATPLAWWLSHTKSKWRAPISSIVTLPLVLPPSVLGFYLFSRHGTFRSLGQADRGLRHRFADIYISGFGNRQYRLFDALCRSALQAASNRSESALWKLLPRSALSRWMLF